ncbi:MAG: class I SAM-dependent methyltransferase [Actinomycetota bacterium]|nr:class I SAM-dependent methyltransferase [Actinomycetota bacterium]
MSASPTPCRLCAAPLRIPFVDLGLSPLANAYLSADDLEREETFYPLRVYVCERCLLVQLPVFARPEEIFGDYAYFSSYSDSWLEHARRYAEAASTRFGLDRTSQVVEVASNDGYLLQYFRAHGIPVLGVEPARNVAAAAEERGIPTVVEFFGAELADGLVRDGHAADLVVANNVLAHVPDVHDFVEGVSRVLKPAGIVTMEFPHLLRLLAERQFDTIYHEHFSYFTLLVVEHLFAEHGLRLFDVEEVPTHGGSLRIYATHAGASPEPTARLRDVRRREQEAGLDRVEGYLGFEEAVRAVKRDLLGFLIEAKRDGRSVVAYGAAAKGNTLLNYCGIRADFVDYVVDRSPHKQGLFLPGTRLPIVPPERTRETRPDFLLILPWNLKEEIIEQMSYVRAWGCRFVVPVPEVALVD